MGSRRVGTTEQLHFHFSLSCIGEGNGNPLQCSCLEIPRDGGAWSAAICGVAQSRTRLKRLSSGSSSSATENSLWRCQALPVLSSPGGEGGRGMQRRSLNQAWLAPAGSICFLGLSEPIAKLRGTFSPIIYFIY